MPTVKEFEAELAQQRKDLRSWTLIVGVLVFVIDVIGGKLYSLLAGAQSLESDPTAWFHVRLYGSIALLVYFLGMWWFARRRPVLACVLAIIGYWVVHTATTVATPALLSFGVAVEIGMTIGLGMVIRSVRRSERALRDINRLGDVFTDARPAAR
ncbi:MAG TPA: hypothetical protein VIX73_01205 [Kofleriaceae bacterium]|jgi:uncharacterized membrane protein AbrB (regulator of aidB expression)